MSRMRKQADYEDVLEPEDPLFLPLRLVSGGAEEFPHYMGGTCLYFLLHVGKTMFIFLPVQDPSGHPAGAGLGSQL